MPARVAYVTSSRGVGGAEQLLKALLEGGRQRLSDQVVIIPFADEKSEELRRFCADGEYRAHRADKWHQLIGIRAWVRSELDQFRPDIVHVLLFHAAVLSASLAHPEEERWLLTKVYGSRRPRRLGRLQERLDRWATLRYDHVVAISKAVRRDLLEEQHVPVERVSLIMPGWEGHALPRQETSRPPTIICVAVLRPEKGHDILFDAFAEVLRHLPNTRLVVVGDGPIRPLLEGRVKAMGLEGSVELTGPVDEVWSRLADADVFALASRSEALGIAIMEAMAAGLPVVAPAVGGIPELVTPGVTGQLVPAGDHLALARQLIDLLQAPERRRSMSVAARSAAAGHHMDRTVTSYMELYEMLAAGSRHD